MRAITMSFQIGSVQAICQSKNIKLIGIEFLNLQTAVVSNLIYDFFLKTNPTDAGSWINSNIASMMSQLISSEGLHHYLPFHDVYNNNNLNRHFHYEIGFNFQNLINHNNGLPWMIRCIFIER